RADPSDHGEAGRDGGGRIAGSRGAPYAARRPRGPSFRIRGDPSGTTRAVGTRCRGLSHGGGAGIRFFLGAVRRALRPARARRSGRRMRRTRIHPAAATAWALFLLAFVLVPRLVPDEAGVRAALERLGAFGPAAFVLAEAVQVVIVPIPGQPLEIPGGYLFGLVPGIVLGSLGAIAGSILAFAIGRRYGRPWVESRIDASARERFDAWLGRGHRAEWAVFWLMLVPAFPRDPLCYLAGLTRLSAGRFALIAVIGRPVGL